MKGIWLFSLLAALALFCACGDDDDDNDDNDDNDDDDNLCSGSALECFCNVTALCNDYDDEMMNECLSYDPAEEDDESEAVYALCVHDCYQEYYTTHPFDECYDRSDWYSYYIEPCIGDCIAD